MDLLAEQHAIDLEPTKDNPFPIEETDGMPPLVINGHIADFNVRRPIGPLAHVESAHHDIAAQNRHLIHSSPDEPNLLFAVNRDVLRVLARLEEHRVALLGRIDRFLKRNEISRPVKRDHNGPRTK